MSEAKLKEAPNFRTLLTTPKIVVEDTSGGDPPMDKYTAGIELSNACRQFYVTRLKAAGKVKERLGLTNGFSSNPDCTAEDLCDETKHTCADENRDGIPATTHAAETTENKKRPTSKLKSNIESKMALLKHEMASLIDQDLALMKQLLTLNEQIEELKWQRKLRGYQAGGGSVASSCNMDNSNVSVSTLSDGEWDSRLDHREVPGKYPTPSSLSLYSDYGTSPRASVDKEVTRSSGPGPSKLLQDNTHKLMGGESTSDLGSSDELTSSNSELPECHTGISVQNPYNSAGEQRNLYSGTQQQLRNYTGQYLKVKTLELSL